MQTEAVVPLVQTSGRAPSLNSAGWSGAEEEEGAGSSEGIPGGSRGGWAGALGPWDLQGLLAEQSSNSRGPPLLSTQPPDVCQRPPWSFQMGDPSH